MQSAPGRAATQIHPTIRNRAILRQNRLTQAARTGEDTAVPGSLVRPPARLQARPESKSRLIFESRSMAETCNLQAITLASPDCDLLDQVPELAPGESANCYRCNCRVSRFAPNCLDHVLALNLTAILLYAVACYFPLLSFGKGGIEVETHLITGIPGSPGLRFYSSLSLFNLANRLEVSQRPPPIACTSA